MASSTHWQSDKSLKECNEYMFTHQVACDVQFHIHYPQSEAVAIAAHKYVLLSRSPVFYAMLCGDLQQNQIEITDVSPEAFKKMLRYLYTDEVQLNGDDVCMVMYAAKKYMIHNLVGSCSKFMGENLNCDNVSTIFNQSLYFSEESLQQSAMSFIRENTLKVVQSSGFLDLTYDALMMLTADDELSIPELELDKAAIRWSEAECGRQNLHPTAENKRIVLGGIVDELRFHTLSPEQFTEFFRTENVLTDSEITQTFLQMFPSEAAAATSARKGPRSAKPVWIDLTCDEVGKQYQQLSQRTFSVSVECDAVIEIHSLKLGRIFCDPPDQRKEIRLEISEPFAGVDSPFGNKQIASFTVTAQIDDCDKDMLIVNFPNSVVIQENKPHRFEITYSYAIQRLQPFQQRNTNTAVSYRMKQSITYKEVTFRCQEAVSVLKSLLFKKAASSN